MVAVGLVAGLLLRPVAPAPVAEEGVIDGHVRVLTPPRPTGSGQMALVETRLGRFRLYAPRSAAWSMGAELRVRGRIGPLSEASSEQWAVRGVIWTQSPPEVVRAGPGFWLAALRVRASFEEFLGRWVRPDVAAVLDGMCFGVTSDVDDEVMRAMRVTGTIHMISTSGFHVGVVIVAVLLLLRRMPVPRWAQLGVAMLLILLYAGAAGLSPPVVRAALMAWILLLAYTVGREPDGLSAWALAGVLWLLFVPPGIVDLSFILSMTAMLGLILYGDRFLGRRTVREYAISMAWSSLVASLTMTPVLALFFGSVSTISVPANLVAIPVSGVLVVGSLLAWLVSLVALPVGVGLAKALLEPMTSGLVWFLQAFAQVPGASVGVPSFSAYALVVIYTAFVLLWRPRARPA